MWLRPWPARNELGAFAAGDEAFLLDNGISISEPVSYLSGRKAVSEMTSRNNLTTPVSPAGLIVLLVLMACLPLACQSTGPMVAQAASPIPDVPMPVGFKMKESNSRSWTSGSLRFVDHLYKGSGGRVQTVEFFEKQMPISGWTSLSKQFTQGRSKLDFAKGREKCRITIYKPGALYPTYVQVAIWNDGK